MSASHGLQIHLVFSPTASRAVAFPTGGAPHATANDDVVEARLIGDGEPALPHLLPNHAANDAMPGIELGSIAR